MLDNLIQLAYAVQSTFVTLVADRRGYHTNETETNKDDDDHTLELHPSSFL